MAKELKCENCCFYWKEDGERWAGCHFNSDEWLGRVAPCEEDDYYEVDEYDYPELWMDGEDDERGAWA